MQACRIRPPFPKKKKKREMGEKGKRKRNKWDGERKTEESNGKENVKTRGGSRSGEGRTSEDTKKGEWWRDNWERTHTHTAV